MDYRKTMGKALGTFLKVVGGVVVTGIFVVGVGLGLSSVFNESSELADSQASDVENPSIGKGCDKIEKVNTKEGVTIVVPKGCTLMMTKTIY